jgi:hypothetical protein
MRRDDVRIYWAALEAKTLSSRAPRFVFSGVVTAALLAGPASAEVIYGSFNNSNDVVSFDTASTVTLISDYPLSGPAPATISDAILGLAVRSDSGQLYGVSGTGIYAIDPNTGVKTLVAPSPLTIQFDEVRGASFQPGTGNLFVTSSATNSLFETNVDTGATTNLGTLAFAPADPNAGKTTFLEGLAWGTPAGGTTPILYGIDTTVGLVAIDSSNSLKATIGPIPAFIGADSGAGFTYSDLTRTAYVNFVKVTGNGTVNQFLYTIDLRTAGTALVGTVGHFPGGVLQIAAANTTSLPNTPSLPTTPQQLIVKGTQMCLDIQNYSYQPVTPAIQYWCEGGLNQRWLASAVGDGSFTLTVQHSGEVLDVTGGSTAPGAQPIQYPYWGGRNQRWYFEPTLDGYYRVISQNSGLCLDIVTTAQTPALTQQNTCGASDSQKWQFVPWQ